MAFDKGALPFNKSVLRYQSLFFRGSMIKKVAIVGTRPYGVLIAQYLLKRSDRVDTKSDPRYEVLQSKNLPKFLYFNNLFRPSTYKKVYRPAIYIPGD